ncbi:MAG: hypothetical protein HYX80_10210 [Chloroflexi bacterium]|nr:hypothetical protein [Chloroflexota bacterium]
MLQNVVEQEIPWSWAEAVHRQTEGNPLFVQETLRYLVEEGHIGKQDGQWKTISQTTIAMAIPEGLKDVIGKRLSRLSPGCNTLLSMAAVVGRDFSLVVLQKVVQVTEEELYTALEEATSAGVLEARSQVGKGSSFWFAHAFFRQTLYQELFAPRRIRTHQQVGRALEEVHAQRLEEHAAELAAHFSQSTEASDLAKAVKYREIAAKRALSVYAYSEAVRLYEECLKAQEVLDPDDKAKQCDLLLALGDALIRAGEVGRCVDEVAPKAFAFAEAVPDPKRASLSGILACRGLANIGQTPAFRTPEGKSWVERCDRYAPPDSVERVWADFWLAVMNMAQAKMSETIKIHKRGVDLARRIGDREGFLRHGGQLLLVGSPLEDGEERKELAEEMMRIPRTALDQMTVTTVLARLTTFFLQIGQRKQIEELMAEEQTVAERTRQVNIRLTNMRSQALLAAIDGRLEEAVDIAHRMMAVGTEYGMLDNARVLVVNGPQTAFIEIGLTHEMLQILEEMTKRYGITGPAWLAREALFKAHLGRQEEAAEILNRQGLSEAEAVRDHNDSSFFANLMMLETATIIGHREAAARVLERFSTYTLPPFDHMSLTCIYRLLGATKALVGRTEEARADYKEALRVSTEMRFRPEVALTRLGLAELLLEHYPKEKKEALEHLDFAIKEFREMKMQPSLERALRHKDILKA